MPTKKISTKEKTPSQKLRNALYLLHVQTEQTISFDEYYQLQMKEIIKKITDQLIPE